MPKQVSFAQDCKLHDGMVERHANLDCVVKRFFFQNHALTERDMCAIGKTPLASFHLYHDLLMLLFRVKQLAKQPSQTWVPVLPNGGGKCAKIFYAHLAHVTYLVEVAEAATKRMYRKQHQQQPASPSAKPRAVAACKQTHPTKVAILSPASPPTPDYTV